MKNTLILIILFLSLVFSSCEKTEKVDNFPKHEGKLVTNCFFSSDSTFRFMLSKSLSPIDNAPFKQLNSTKAYIKIFEDNVFFDSLICRGGLYPSYSSTTLKTASANHTYRFECNYPGLGFVSSEDYLPDTAGVQKAKGFYTILNSYESNDSIINGNFATNLNIDYTNNPKYLMVIIKKYYYYYYNPNMTYNYQEVYEDISDLNASNESEYIASKLFVSNPNGIKNLNLKWVTDYGYIFKNKSTSNYIITSYSCSKASYEYLKRQALQLENQDDPFSQPTPISNNIVNGYGIFGGINLTNYLIAF